MTPAEELRAAAAKLREKAKAARPFPWRSAGTGDVVVDLPPSHPDYATSKDCVTVLADGNIDDAEWVALMHPGLAEPLAALLEYLASQSERWPVNLTAALGVARVINGGAQ